MNNDLQAAIERLTEKLSIKNLAKARDGLTTKYRETLRHGKAKQFMDSDLERLSYLLTRMPATYAVIEAVLNEISHRIPNFSIESLLDLGSGPGTGFFAASSFFPNLQTSTLIEQDGELIELGKKLQKETDQKVHICFEQKDMNKFIPEKTYDLVLISYALNELETTKRQIVIENGWKASSKILVLIEPGTKEGFSIIKEARRQLIELGANMVAPCPQSHLCPMPDNDWCHFSKRVARTSLHRHLKNGSLGHEDEKFSYVVFSKTKNPLPDGRILRHPEKHTGHLKLQLCTKNQALTTKTFSKRDGDLYKQMRKLEWGDVLEDIVN